MSNVWDEVPDWGGVGARRLERDFHHGSEELLIVLRGRPTVRTHDGTRQLEEGDVLTFARGPEGAHAITNETEAVARVVIVSTNVAPDVAEYPASGKVGIWVNERGQFFRAPDAVEHAGPGAEAQRQS